MTLGLLLAGAPAEARTPRAALERHLQARGLYDGPPLPVGSPRGPQASRWEVVERPLGVTGWHLFESTPQGVLHASMRCDVVRSNGTVVTENKEAELGRILRAAGLLEAGAGPPPDWTLQLVAALVGTCRPIREGDLRNFRHAQWRYTPVAPPRIVREDGGLRFDFFETGVSYRDHTLRHRQVVVSSDASVNVRTSKYRHGDVHGPRREVVADFIEAHHGLPVLQVSLEQDMGDWVLYRVAHEEETLRGPRGMDFGRPGTRVLVDSDGAVVSGPPEAAIARFHGALAPRSPTDVTTARRLANASEAILSGGMLVWGDRGLGRLAEAHPEATFDPPTVVVRRDGRLVLRYVGLIGGTPDLRPVLREITIPPEGEVTIRSELLGE